MTADPPTPDRSILEVDAAVRDGLSRIAGPRRVNGVSMARPSAGAVESGVVTFSGRLLSLRSVEALSPNLRTVAIAPGTVVTPLAREFLKRLNVAIRLTARDEVERARDAGEWGFAVETASGLGDAVRRALLDDRESWVEAGRDGLELAHWVSEESGRGGFLLTAESSLAVYRACQVTGVRAATAAEPEAVDRAIRALGVNLLAVEPIGRSIPWIRQLATTFRRGGGPIAPKGIT